jgi:hypothetical protein
MKKMYDGRNVATRPIPIIVDSGERRAIAAAAADQKPKTSAVNFPTTGPRPGGADAVFGTKVTGAPGNVINNRSGTFNPATGLQEME